MHFVRVTTTTAALLLLGALVPAFAQHEEKGEKQAKPQQQEHAQQVRPQQQAKPQQQQRVQQPQQARPQQQQRVQQTQQQRQQQQVQPSRQQQRSTQQARQAQPQQRQQQKYQPQQRTRQQAVAWQKQRSWAPQGAWQPHTDWQQGRSRNWGSDHRDWGQRGGYGGYYISASIFGLSFGNQHWFRMHSRPYMYMGYPRFSYGGYSFLLLDPWPYEWGDNWYASDDLYIDYDNGYYLYNRRYPGMGLAISVVM
ncbi:MAG: hypothetical protein P4K98_10940 [Bryobacteraceae bacterium]|nr:hypothetical protein [Bryobacteraceae bacterium]